MRSFVSPLVRLFRPPLPALCAAQHLATPVGPGAADAAPEVPRFAEAPESADLQSRFRGEIDGGKAQARCVAERENALALAP